MNTGNINTLYHTHYSSTTNTNHNALHHHLQPSRHRGQHYNKGNAILQAPHRNRNRFRGMDKAKNNGKINPHNSANLISKLFFSWSFPLIKLGFKKRLEHEDIYQIPPHYEAARCTRDLEREWDKEVNRKGDKASFRLALARAFGVQYMMVSFIILTEDISRLVQPVLLRFLIEYFTESGSVTTAQAYWLATGLAVCTVVGMFSGPQVVFALTRCGLTWQNSSCGLIYRKLMRLSNSSRNSIPSGYITDILSTDTEKLDWMIWYLYSIWQAPLHMIVVVSLLYHVMGVSVFVALGFMIIIVPLQVVMAKFEAYYREKTMTAMDKRVGIMSEIVSAMRLIKMYCWEKPFGDIVDEIRGTELGYVWKCRLWSSGMREMYTFNQRLVTAIIIVVYVATTGNITASTIFPAFALLNILTESVLHNVPTAVRTWFDVDVSVKRIQDFLLLGEQDFKETSKTSDTDIGTVNVDNATASWTLDSPRKTLQEIEIKCKQNDLVMVIGDVGSGKSSLLLALLGELPLSSGTISVCGKIAYAPQQPWVFSSTLRQNILFGKEFDSERYYKALKAAVLDKDIAELPYGDKSLVGERGVQLSGGQKARLGIARALYSDADVYLLDDPLSAVDPTVGNQLMKRCMKGMLKDKTVILVTHQLQYLPEASNIIVLTDGKIEQSASYQQLLESGFDFGKVYHHHAEDEESKSSDKPKLQRMLSDTVDSKLKSQISHVSIQQEENDEDRVHGEIGWQVYKDYFSAGASWVTMLLFLLLCVATQSAYNIGDWWLSVWSVSGTNIPPSNNITAEGSSMNISVTSLQPNLDTMGYATIYLTFVALMFIVGLTRTLLYFKIMLKAAKTLHNQLYKSIVRTPIRFFDTTPKGRIINRFSGDMNKVDDGIPNVLLEFIQYLSMVIGSVLLIMIINPYVILIGIPVFVGLIVVRKAYMKTNLSIERLFSTANSPVLGHLTNTIEGVQVIRAFNSEDVCIKDFEQHYDLYMGTWYTYMGVFGWFQFHNDVCAAVFNILACYACVLAGPYLTAGEAGLILSYVVPLMWQVESCVRTSSEVEMQMVGVERLIEYTNLPSERALESSEEDKPEPSWPQHGVINFDHVSFAYSSDSPLILNNIHFRIEAGHKIGIVGRTGAGKSSMVQSMFRLAEPLGQILVDGLSITELGLHDVRNAMSIIPQDPVLFSGTVRSNLDSFGDVSDAETWRALEQVQLKELVSSLDGGLDSKILECGCNFSVGQRQLFCLARAIMRKRKILVLDEATANVDKKTDTVIQKTIRKEFKDCTVLTIAHRLHTVMDSDKILVLDKGHLVEYDSPYNLLQQKGLLYKMVEQTGKHEQQTLTDIARVALMTKTILPDNIDKPT